MLALAVEEGGERLCLVCAYSDGIKSGYPNLYWEARGALSRVPMTEICDRCGLNFGRPETFDAAKVIANFVK